MNVSENGSEEGRDVPGRRRSTSQGVGSWCAGAGARPSSWTIRMGRKLRGLRRLEQDLGEPVCQAERPRCYVIWATWATEGG